MLGSAIETADTWSMKSVSKVCEVKIRKKTFTFGASPAMPDCPFKRTRAIAKLKLASPPEVGVTDPSAIKAFPCAGRKLSSGSEFVGGVKLGFKYPICWFRYVITL